MKKLKKNNKGFSLVELIAAVGILGAVVVILLNSFVISTNVSKKVIKKSEATLAGKNVLEAAAARPTDDFYTEDSAGELERLLGNNLEVSLIDDSEYKSEGNFTVALENLKAGGTTFDAMVEFSRGDEADTQSDGLYLINSKKIKLAQYDAMDGVLCQPFEIGSNPDLLVEDEIGAQAIAYGLDPEADLVKRDREISIYVWHDPTSDWTVMPDVPKPGDDDFEDVENEGRYHYATATYSYTFTYKKPFRINNRLVNSLTWERSYSIFPGGYVPQSKDGTISLYIMYYPVFSDKYASDSINIYNNSLDNEGTVLDFYDADGEIYTVPLNTYLYCQEPYDYNSITGKYEYTTDNYTINMAGKRVNESISLRLPSGYNIDNLEGTYIYTNAKEISDKTLGTFSYYIQEGAYVGWGQNTAKDLDSDLVRKKDKIKIYNIKVSLYPQGSLQDNEGVKSFDPDLKPSYEIYGTKTN